MSKKSELEHNLTAEASFFTKIWLNVQSFFKRIAQFFGWLQKSRPKNPPERPQSSATEDAGLDNAIAQLKNTSSATLASQSKNLPVVEPIIAPITPSVEEPAVSLTPRQPLLSESVIAPVQPVAVPMTPPVQQPAVVQNPGPETLVEQIRRLYADSYFFTKFTAEEIASLPEINAAVNYSSRMIYPLSVSALKGHTVVRGMSSGNPFIGFRLSTEPNSPTITLVKKRFTWKAVQRDFSETRENWAVEEVYSRGMTFDDLANLKTAFDARSQVPVRPPIVIPLQQNEHRAVAPNESVSQPQNVNDRALSEVNRLYPTDILVVCNANAIAALPVINIREHLYEDYSDSMMPDVYALKFDQIQPHRAVRGLDGGLPFISYIATDEDGQSTAYTLFKAYPNSSWKVIARPSGNNHDSISSFYSMLPDPSYLHLRRLATVLNVNPAPGPRR